MERHHQPHHTTHLNSRRALSDAELIAYNAAVAAEAAGEATKAQIYLIKKIDRTKGKNQEKRSGDRNKRRERYRVSVDSNDIAVGGVILVLGIVALPFFFGCEAAPLLFTL